MAVLTPLTLGGISFLLFLSWVLKQLRGCLNSEVKCDLFPD